MWLGTLADIVLCPLLGGRYISAELMISELKLNNNVKIKKLLTFFSPALKAFHSSEISLAASLSLMFL
jgi:hypothetical protein